MVCPAVHTPSVGVNVQFAPPEAPVALHEPFATPSRYIVQVQALDPLVLLVCIVKLPMVPSTCTVCWAAAAVLCVEIVPEVGNAGTYTVVVPTEGPVAAAVIVPDDVNPAFPCEPWAPVVPWKP